MHIRPHRRPVIQGFTLIELLIIVSMVGILAIVAFGLLFRGCGPRGDQVQDYMQQLHPGTAFRKTCTSYGLARRCDVITDKGQTIALSCDVSGCREARGVLQP